MLKHVERHHSLTFRDHWHSARGTDTDKGHIQTKKHCYADTRRKAARRERERGERGREREREGLERRGAADLYNKHTPDIKHLGIGRIGPCVPAAGSTVPGQFKSL